jgi:hypothetical protein
MGAIDTEIANVELRLENRRADFVLCDHSLERYIEDLNTLEARGIVDPSWTFVIADLEYYPGDTKPLDNSQGIEALQEEVSGAPDDKFLRRVGPVCANFRWIMAYRLDR